MLWWCWVIHKQPGVVPTTSNRNGCYTKQYPMQRVMIRCWFTLMLPLDFPRRIVHRLWRLHFISHFSLLSSHSRRVITTITHFSVVFRDRKRCGKRTRAKRCEEQINFELTDNGHSQFDTVFGGILVRRYIGHSPFSTKNWRLSTKHYCEANQAQ